jgi:hypothetical protein
MIIACTVQDECGMPLRSHPDVLQLPADASSSLHASLLCAFRIVARVAQLLDMIYGHGVRALSTWRWLIYVCIQCAHIWRAYAVQVPWTRQLWLAVLEWISLNAEAAFIGLHSIGVGGGLAHLLFSSLLTFPTSVLVPAVLLYPAAPPSPTSSTTKSGDSTSSLATRPTSAASSSKSRVLAAPSSCATSQEAVSGSSKLAQEASTPAPSLRRRTRAQAAAAAEAEASRAAASSRRRQQQPETQEAPAQLQVDDAAPAEVAALLPRLQDAAVVPHEPDAAAAALVQRLQALPHPLGQALVLYDVESTPGAGEMAVAAARAPAGPHSSLYSSASTRRIISIKVGCGGLLLPPCLLYCL